MRNIAIVVVVETITGHMVATAAATAAMLAIAHLAVKVGVVAQQRMSPLRFPMLKGAHPSERSRWKLAMSFIFGMFRSARVASLHRTCSADSHSDVDILAFRK